MYSNERIANIIELLEEAPLSSIKSVLDVGIGNGEIAVWLSKKGIKCTGIGININNYKINKKLLEKKYGITLVESYAEKMPFQNNTFDAVIMSHVLEHCFNIKEVIDEVKRVMNDNGWLFIFVPPYSDFICAGHVNTGWNIGQLIYNLILLGFDVKKGKFIKYGYNICAYVQKSQKKLPRLQFDKGDIEILNKKNIFPFEIKNKSDNDGFNGNLIAVNWSESSPILKKLIRQENKLKVVKYWLSIMKRISPSLITFIGIILRKTGNLLTNPDLKSGNNKINPTVLTVQSQNE